MRQILISVLACDYGLTADDCHVGDRLGKRSVARLQEALQYAGAQTLPVQFVFSAGKLVDTDSRLCDLQYAYVAARGFTALVPPRRVQIWGSKLELHFLANTAANFRESKVVIVSEDYHVWRLKLLAKSLGMPAAKVLGASSLDDPPSFGDLIHEVLGVGELYLPIRLVNAVKGFRYGRLRRNLKS